ncbi:protein S100-A9 [Cricetulus griseus]|uniref:Protein S100-A9 n=1 Tax=Cricetulus griseus TaxID=10029 RepID=G3I8A9_CRIGR|nr:protein S100-A9 [Cricetulus griseus]XP_035317615.1 protein S100-A9 [Cricetulus griseus]EGW10422.1 Protein S100-A9 [Cricetulus griseus]ERE90690.1 EF-HAND 2 containing protein [Cricetulus griseus]
MATKTPSLLEQSITTIIDTFHKYSTQEGHPDTLSQREFIKMVKTDLANFLKKEKRKVNLINDIMEDLDTNLDKQLSFEEFSILMAKMVYATHEKMHEKNPRGHDHSHGSGLGK